MMKTARRRNAKSSTGRAPLTLINGDCLQVLVDMPAVACIFADPPDNIGLAYDAYSDQRSEPAYRAWLERCLWMFSGKASVVWLSFNARWTFAVGTMFDRIAGDGKIWEAKPSVQTFTFGQHNHHDLANCHRPLWRLRRNDAPLYPDAIRVPSWRQENGDKRADPRGRVPGDVFDFPRVTGNSRQRRRWHPTQLHEGLVERCIKLATIEGQTVLDPFGGTGTTLRVCRRLNRPCIAIEFDRGYCEKMAAEHGLEERQPGFWT